MSLKAKIEAVIYAAEEPVTLPQFLQLFATEALEHRASRLGQPAPELDAAAEPSAPELAAEAGSLAEPAAESRSEDQAAASRVPEPAAASASASVDVITDEPTTHPDLRLTRLRERQAREELRLLLAELTADYSTESRGLEIREVAGGFRIATKPVYHDSVRSLIRTLKPPLKLSLPALETLAVIAYKQPITAPEISDVRGVDSAGVLGSLIARKLVTTAGRKAVIGRPILYKTTRDFLLRFGLKDLNELPSLEEFEKMAATELDFPEPGEGSEPVVSVELRSEPEAELNDEPEVELNDDLNNDLHGPDATPHSNEPSPDALQPTTPEPDQPTPGATMPQPEREPLPEPSAAEDVQAAPQLAQAPSDPEAEARASSEIAVDAEDTPEQTAPDLPGVTRDTHGQLPIQSSRGSLIRRPAEEDEAI